MCRKTFLIEIGTEELPSKSLRHLAESFTLNVTLELNKKNLVFDTVQWFASPRRLAIKVLNIIISNSKTNLKKSNFETNFLLKKKIFSKNNIIKNISSFHDKIINLSKELFSNKKNKKLNYPNINSIDIILSSVVNNAITKLSAQKLIYWEKNNTYFVRPIHTVTMLLDDRLISSKIFGIHSGRIIYGHRFIGEQKIIINNANQYPQILLEKGKVIADYEQRKSKIKSGIEQVALKINGNADLDEKLLEEVTSLVEWPVVLLGSFKSNFLKIPKEILIISMKNNQKCFPIYTHDGRLLPNFIFVTNIESENNKQIISDNEKVMHFRLTDAEFFLNKDRKIKLEDNLPLLKKVIFHKNLGSMYDKTNRIKLLSGWIANQIGANISVAIRAGLLSKCDLITKIVSEFVGIQGYIGMYYALNDGESKDIAIALNEQYKPRFANDELPSNNISCTLAIADKIDNLVGILGIGYNPKSNKDPFGLRRSALGILRIIINNNLNLDLQSLIEKSVELYSNKLTNCNVVNEAIDFILNRFLNLYMKEGYSVEVIKAVIARRPTCPSDFNRRIKALTYFFSLKESSILIKANKRIINILSKINEPLNGEVNSSLLKEDAEIKLNNNLIIMKKKILNYINEYRYQEALINMIYLSKDIDIFFENVMVFSQNRKLCINRLNLLYKLRKIFINIDKVFMI